MKHDTNWPQESEEQHLRALKITHEKKVSLKHALEGIKKLLKPLDIGLVLEQFEHWKWHWKQLKEHSSGMTAWSGVGYNLWPLMHYERNHLSGGANAWALGWALKCSRQCKKV